MFNEAWLPRERTEIARLMYENAIREHAELWDAWKMMETKAQVVLSIGGVFEAGLFAFLATAPPNSQSFLIGTLLLLLILTLLGSIIFAIASVGIRPVNSPHLGAVEVNFINSILDGNRTPQLWSITFENLLRDAAARWANNNDSMSVLLNKKATQLYKSQQCLIAASLSATGFFTALVFFCR
jgi:ABC-type transport system involved in multi-copper enzyme maturation permease subunit